MKQIFKIGSLVKWRPDGDIGIVLSYNNILYEMFFYKTNKIEKLSGKLINILC